VERGIVPGERIVTEGYHKLTPGIKVRVAKAASDVQEDNDN